MLESVIVGIVCFAIGYAIAAVVGGGQIKASKIEARMLRSQIGTEAAQKEQTEQAFKAIASDVLSGATEQLLSQASDRLGTISEHLRQNLGQTKDEIGNNIQRVHSVLSNLSEQAIALNAQVRAGKEVSQELVDTTQGLKRVLSSSQARGQWGERMVEDILRVLGLVKGINYEVQKSLSTGERPDFTFILPDDKTINMDVKFPIDKYEEYIRAEDSGVRAAAEKAFLTAVRGHVKTTAGRGYIDPAGGTVDYVLMFIPNEAITAFIHEHDPGLLDYSLEKGIVLCSPITLYVILSLIRQSIKSFAMAAKTGEIMRLLEEFGTQWEKYVEVQTKMGESLAQVQKRYDTMVTTRTRMLGRVVEKVGSLEQPQLAGAASDTPFELEE